MALFGSKKNTNADAPAKEAKKAEKKAKKPAKASGALRETSRDVAHVLRQPRITEKATLITTDANVYVFEIDPRATKADVAAAMAVFYKVNPVKVRIAPIPSKKVIIRGKRGVKSGGKKAYVFLKEGESIEVI